MMRRMRWPRLFLLLVVSAGCATRSSVDAERLQGAWRVSAVERNGATDAGEVESTLIFIGNHVNFIPKLEGHIAAVRDAALG